MQKKERDNTTSTERSPFILLENCKRNKKLQKNTKIQFTNFDEKKRKKKRKRKEEKIMLDYFFFHYNGIKFYDYFNKICKG